MTDGPGAGMGGLGRDAAGSVMVRAALAPPCEKSRRGGCVPHGRPIIAAAAAAAAASGTAAEGFQLSAFDSGSGRRRRRSPQPLAVRCLFAARCRCRDGGSAAAAMPPPRRRPRPVIRGQWGQRGAQGDHGGGGSTVAECRHAEWRPRAPVPCCAAGPRAGPRRRGRPVLPDAGPPLSSPGPAGRAAVRRGPSRWRREPTPRGAHATSPRAVRRSRDSGNGRGRGAQAAATTPPPPTPTIATAAAPTIATTAIAIVSATAAAAATTEASTATSKATAATAALPGHEQQQQQQPVPAAAWTR